MFSLGGTFTLRAARLSLAHRILILPPSSDASGRPLRSWKAPRTRSLERLRYVAHAFQRADSGGFPAASWWYCQDAPAVLERARILVDGRSFRINMQRLIVGFN